MATQTQPVVAQEPETVEFYCWVGTTPSSQIIHMYGGGVGYGRHTFYLYRYRSGHCQFDRRPRAPQLSRQRLH